MISRSAAASDHQNCSMLFSLNKVTDQPVLSIQVFRDFWNDQALRFFPPLSFPGNVGLDQPIGPHVEIEDHIHIRILPAKPTQSSKWHGIPVKVSIGIADDRPLYRLGRFPRSYNLLIYDRQHTLIAYRMKATTTIFPNVLSKLRDSFPSDVTEISPVVWLINRRCLQKSNRRPNAVGLAIDPTTTVEIYMPIALVRLFRIIIYMHRSRDRCLHPTQLEFGIVALPLQFGNRSRSVNVSSQVFKTVSRNGFQDK